MYSEHTWGADTASNRYWNDASPATAANLDLNLRTESGCSILTLYNASDEPHTAVVQGGLMPIVQAASCGLFGDAQEEIPVRDNSIQVEIAPRMVRIIQLRHAIDT